MSKFFSKKYENLKAYVPGEQPKERLIKLNTNESPFPPSPLSQKLARQAAGDLNLYSDLNCSFLKEIASEKFGIGKENVLFTNGSDEALSFAFAAYCDETTPAAFADVTYGFYPVYANYYGVKYREIPVKDDLSIDPKDYYGLGATVFIANPNAQTGTYLSPDEIEKIVIKNQKNVVVIDEAYIDFGGESVIPLTKKYDNLLVVRTFSKSRSLAGARLGFAVANEKLIEDLTKIKFSFNPYNVNDMTQAAGAGALIDEDYFESGRKAIIENRDFLVENLKRLGFSVTDSKGNFVLARPRGVSGEIVCKKLREQKILVRRFDMKRISEYIRITIGKKEDMITLVEALEKIL